MWQCEIRHEGLHKYRVVKGATSEIMQLRAEMQMRSWNEQWTRAEATQAKRQAQLQAAYNKVTKQKLASDRTREAQRALDGLETLLTSALEVDHAIDWSLLVDNSDYPIAKPTRPLEEAIPREPNVNDPEFEAQISFLTRIIPSKRDKERARVPHPDTQGMGGPEIDFFIQGDGRLFSARLNGAQGKDWDRV